MIKCGKETTQPTSPIMQKVTGKKICWNTKKRSAAIESEEKKIQIKHERREHALAEISATIELDKKEAILAKLRVDEDMEDIDELADLMMVAPRDVAALKAAILAYVQLAQAEKYSLKQQTRLRVEQNFSIQHVSQQYMTVWRQG